MPHHTLLDRWLNPQGLMRQPNAGTDAPGTNSRVDVTTPDDDVAQTAKRVSGAHPDTLGYPMHGDKLYDPSGKAGPALREAQRSALRDQAVLRYPNLSTHGRSGPAVPDYNVFYSHLRDREAYSQIVTNTAHGSWTVGTTSKQAITLDTAPNLHLSQFPGAIGVYPVLLLWAFAQSVTTATGEYSMNWELLGGDFLFPLGEFNAGKPDNTEYPRWIVPMLITDANQTALGNLIITSNGVAGTPTIFWRLGIGWAYLLPAPAFKGYVPLAAGAAWSE